MVLCDITLKWSSLNDISSWTGSFHTVLYQYSWKTLHWLSGWHPTSRASFCLLLDLGGEKKALAEFCQAYKGATAQTSELVNIELYPLVGSNCSFECEHLFIDKLIVIIEPAAPSTQLLDLGSGSCVPVTCTACSTLRRSNLIYAETLTSSPADRRLIPYLRFLLCWICMKVCFCFLS